MQINLVGFGMGGSSMTLEAHKAVEEAEVIIAAPRLLDALPTVTAEKLALALPDAVAEAIRTHPEWERVCVLLSGDPGFYSGATRLTSLLSEWKPRLIPGLSSVQVLAARMGRPWQSFHLVSAHGRDCDVLAEVLNHPEVFFLTGNRCTAQDICCQLCAAALGDAKVTVGEDLGTINENLISGRADDFAKRRFAPLSVLLVENKRRFKSPPQSPGLDDAAFIRGEVPMTKRELRVNILSLLRIRSDDLLYDVGAGTGSVAVEMALLARRGRVFAIECAEDAAALIERNKEHFGVYNLTLVQGLAPDALKDLPPPQAAFIGGSKGQMRSIIESLLRKNPAVRLVISAIALETVHEAMRAMQELGVADLQLSQIAVSHGQCRGGLHLLRAQNPIFLISGGGSHGA